MSSLSIALVTLSCVLGGLLFGLFVRHRLPDHHVKDDSKDILKTATATIGTLVALVIGLLVSSAKGSLDSASNSLTQTGAKIIALDRILIRYGPETNSIREFQRKSLAAAVDRYWPHQPSQAPDASVLNDAADMEELHERIHSLTPKTDHQRELQAQALQASNEILQTRWMLIEQTQNPVPTPFLVILAFWLMVLFTGFGLLTPTNITSVAALVVCAVSMSGAVFLILEMNQPLDGLIKVSPTPLRKALDVIGK